MLSIKKKSGKTMTWIHENWSCQGKCPSQVSDIEDNTESQVRLGAEGSGAINFGSAGKNRQQERMDGE